LTCVEGEKKGDVYLQAYKIAGSLEFSGQVKCSQVVEVKCLQEISISETPSTNVENGASDETNSNSEEGVSKEENMKIIFAEARAAVADEKVKQMELEIEKLEGELREAIAIEAAVY
jgi:hypothetical protein